MVSTLLLSLVCVLTTLLLFFIASIFFKKEIKVKNLLVGAVLLTLSMASQAELLRIDPGVGPVADVFVEFDGTLVGGGLDVAQPVFSEIRLQLIALNEANDDTVDDDRLTVQFGYFSLDGGGVFLGYDPLGFSVTWADIVAAQLGADADDELVFSSNATNFLSAFGPIGTALPADYAVFAFIEGVQVGRAATPNDPGTQFAFLDFTNAPVSPVNAPVTFSILLLSLFGLLVSRKIK
jgi:hypothetical protein